MTEAATAGPRTKSGKPLIPLGANDTYAALVDLDSNEEISDRIPGCLWLWGQEHKRIGVLFTPDELTMRYTVTITLTRNSRRVAMVVFADGEQFMQIGEPAYHLYRRDTFVIEWGATVESTLA